MTAFSDSKRLIRIDDAEGPNTALDFARRAASPQEGLQETSASRSYAVPGTQASGTIVFSSLCIMAGLGVGGFFGLHAYVHRNDPPRSGVAALPTASPVPQPALLPPQASSAGLTDAPRADTPAVSPSEQISARTVKTAQPAAFAATADKPAASESASDNPY